MRSKIMYAWQLYEKIKDAALKAFAEGGNDYMYGLGSTLYNELKNEGFSSDQAMSTVFGAFACVACNDGKVSYAEHESFKTMISNSDVSYDDFFDVMSKYNRQEFRDQTAKTFASLRNQSTVLVFLKLCIMVAVVDGSIHRNEELFCTSLCESYLNRFDY